MAFGRTKEWKFPLFIEAALNYMARGRLREYIAWKQELYKGLPLLAVLLHCLCVFELLHITAEAPLSALKSAIAKNGMGVTSRP